MWRSVVLLVLLAILANFPKGFTSLLISGEKYVSASRGSSIDIVWRLSSLPKALALAVHVNNTSNSNKIASFITKEVDRNETIRTSTQPIDVIKRSKVLYTYIGEKNGEKAATVTLTISQLELTDERIYLVQILPDMTVFKTAVIVNYGPEECGLPLRPFYVIDDNRKVTISWNICGKPKPRVQCTINNKTVLAIATNVNKNNYTYTANILTDMKIYESRMMVCNAIQNGVNVAGFTEVVAAHSSLRTRFISNLQFWRKENNCSKITWTMINDDATKKCILINELLFSNKQNITLTVKVDRTHFQYEDCCREDVMSSESVQFITVIGLVSKISGSFITLDQVASDMVLLESTRHHVTYTPRPDTMYTVSSMLRKKDDKSTNNMIIIYVLVIFIVLLISAILVFITLIKLGKVQVILLTRTRAKNATNTAGVSSSNLVIANDEGYWQPPNEYMELSGPHKEKIYEEMSDNCINKEKNIGFEPNFNSYENEQNSKEIEKEEVDYEAKKNDNGQAADYEFDFKTNLSTTPSNTVNDYEASYVDMVGGGSTPSMSTKQLP